MEDFTIKDFAFKNSVNWVNFIDMSLLMVNSFDDFKVNYIILLIFITSFNITSSDSTDIDGSFRNLEENFNC